MNRRRKVSDKELHIQIRECKFRDCPECVYASYILKMRRALRRIVRPRPLDDYDKLQEIAAEGLESPVLPKWPT